MNTFVFISQFCDAIAAAAFDMGKFRFRSFRNFTGQFSDDFSNFCLTGNAEVRRNIGIKDDSFCIFCTAGKATSTALTLRQCFFYFADKGIFFHSEFLIRTCKDKTEYKADTNHDDDGHDRNK